MSDETPAGVGHNSAFGEFSKGQLKSFIERIEKLEAEKKEYTDDIRSVYAEAKANGYDVKVIRRVIRERKMDADERAEQETLRDLYLQALGMLFE